ncbi:zinc finger MYM-type protein 1-like protein, partial [Tanacetum coccineum]
ILKDHVKGLTLKLLSTTWWESRSGANSIAENELGDFKFIVAKVVWFDILYTVNLVSKRIQSKDILIDVAIKEIVKMFYLYIVDQSIASLTTRFEQYQEYENLFGFLFTSYNLKSYDDNGLMVCCSLLEVALKMNYKSDVDAIELCVELWLLKNLFPNESLGPTKVLRHLKETDCFLMQ